MQFYRKVLRRDRPCFAQRKTPYVADNAGFGCSIEFDFTVDSKRWVKVVDVDAMARSVVQSSIEHYHATGVDADNLAREPLARNLVGGGVSWFHDSSEDFRPLIKLPSGEMW
jgi:hypothetical protein